MINRRALECLIKAGALSAFGLRSQLLAVLDRMMAVSQQAQGAASQYTMFDLPAFAFTARLAADLPQIPEVQRRELLSWEKELVSAYISDHPLSRLWADLQQTITVLTGQIDESMAGQPVTVAGMVNHVRRTQTRKGDSMAFVQLEDLQGTVEVVVFPRLWGETKDLWTPERVLVVRGKVSFRGQDASILADSVSNEITTAHPVDELIPPPIQGPVHLHVTIPRSSDMQEVVKRLGQVYDLMQRYPGEDRFSLYLENGIQGRIRISFPNDKTGHSVELESELRSLLGAGTIRVESVG